MTQTREQKELFQLNVDQPRGSNLNFVSSLPAWLQIIRKYRKYLLVNNKETFSNTTK